MSLLRASRGKHVKPSFIRRGAAPAALAGGLTAGLVAADVVAATTASAASASDLARLRACESGGNYRINTGNGYYGAYQFDVSTWRSVGGTGRPDQASPATQDALASRLQAQRGWSPWPSCSAKLGLRGSGSGSSGSAERATPSRTVERSTQTKATRTRAAAPKATAPKATARKATAPQRARTSAPVVTTPQRTHAHTHPSRTGARATTSAMPYFAPGTVVRQDLDTYRSTVRAWQARMVQRGWDLQVDGIYGPESAGVAAAFTAEKGLSTARWGDLNRSVFAGAWTLRVTR